MCLLRGINRVVLKLLFSLPQVLVLSKVVSILVDRGGSLLRSSWFIPLFSNFLLDTVLFDLEVLLSLMGREVLKI